jgi:hypothetical protein
VLSRFFPKVCRTDLNWITNPIYRALGARNDAADLEHNLEYNLATAYIVWRRRRPEHIPQANL